MSTARWGLDYVLKGIIKELPYPQILSRKKTP